MVSVAADVAAHQESQKRDISPKRVIVAASIGNALEWYDFSVYATFAPIFALQFFRRDDPQAALLSTLGVFAVGFLVRPIGGIIFGWLADLKGRRQSMTISMSVTAIGCLIIAVAPTYNSIGIFAPFVLTLGRMIQGFGLGGEIGSSFTFLVESAPRQSRGLWSSAMFIAIVIGSIVSTVFGLVLSELLSKESLAQFGWRIPFVVGGLLGIYAMNIRRKLPETGSFTSSAAKSGTAARQSPFVGVWRHKRAALQLVSLTVGPTVMYNTWIASSTNYAVGVKGYSPQSGMWCLLIGCFSFIIVQPFWGVLSDRFGRKPNLLIGTIASAILVIPLLWLIQDQVWQLALAISAGLIVLSAWTSISPAVFAEMFPTEIRASGIAVPYSITVAVFGGTAPYIQAWLGARHQLEIFAVYLIILNLVSASAALVIPETKEAGLD